ncbi:M4 family metallopeptidase [Hymenobacter sp. DH14]|uniref:M4 family metallopeptidase n=1 Tax=Hymenobacter cyanobacteriorum TaxID=2926463 RepID=A0A9X1VHC2_9BACT|nr:M4 family metallopeptidase [Hymenobacter cyanobacteriorum]MCI1188683.1 M4 family metallopeptidase [Hymenobacter cyanobacteriorum]
MKKQYSAAALLMLGTLATAQAQDASRIANKVLGKDGQPELVQFSAEGKAALRGLSGDQVLRQQLGLGQADQLVQRAAEADQLGMVHQKFNQLYQGIPVEHASYTVHSKGGTVESISGDFEKITNLNTTPSLSEKTALGRAMASVGARLYKWQTNEADAASYKPTGQLVIVRDNRTENGPQVLAWKFNVYAAQPVSRAYIYVDAHTGDVVLTDNIIKHATPATATFATAYSGTRSLADETATGGYHLREYTRGLGIETYNCKKGSSYTAAVDFIDADNSWTEYNNANFDNVAGDAHFGAQTTYDYWKAVFGRNSYDNAGAKIKSYVHFDDTPGDGVGYENAYWDGTEMTYGDGASTFKPLTALDVCGHEIGHAVCEKTANLTYSNESGAMNEGFSDIWGASVEAFGVSKYSLTGKSTYLIGEEIMKAGGALRSMSSPNTYQQPAYYKGTYWYTGTADNGGVHTNSGVLNYWYYLISNGKTGTNEKSQSFSVAGLGLDAAAKITFRAESVYLTASSNYANARTYTIKAAQDLYGVGSTQEQSVTNAWYAVGIGAAYSGGTTGCGTPTSLTAGSITTTGATLSWAAISGATSYNVQYRVSGATTWTTTTSTTTSKALTGLTTATTYQYQVQSVCSSGSSAYSAIGSFSTSGGTTTPTYCASKGSSVTYEWIDLVQLGSINRTSGADGGYYDGTALNTSVAAGSSQTMTLSAGFSGSAYDENWGIYVDWNQNGTFETAERMDYGVVTASAGNLTSTWTVPTTAKNGKTRMRIVMTYGAATAACGSYTEGETEDYSITVTGGTLTGSGVATLSGNSLGNAVARNLEVYPNPGTSIINLVMPSTSPIASVLVTDVRGARVAGAVLNENALNISALAKGMYTLTVSDGQKVFHQRFVKE